MGYLGVPQCSELQVSNVLGEIYLENENLVMAETETGEAQSR